MANRDCPSRRPEVDADARRARQVPGDHDFALCLTHDVDRPYKTYQAPYYAVTERDPSHLASLLPGRNPYWSFGRIKAIESDLGVRSAFYFLDEQSLFTDRPRRELLDPNAWMLYAGRYEITDPQIVDLVRDLDAGGWEIGLHGSYESYADRDRLRAEKRAVESVLGREVRGIRQHHLNLQVPDTWAHQAAIGLSYDTSLGSSTDYGFQYGYGVRRPFDDAFVAFPLTAMEIALPIESDPERAWDVCESLLREARENAAVMSVLWHPRFFCEDTPAYGPIYRRLIERALELDAWVGPPGELYDTLDHADPLDHASPSD
ncbi:polysaccharide deacetylase family protein [Halobellus sp. GM3]|uniref:polysaccharide deacetylase family protein n=1 Tax=Halobellus sp. GM3 TaxID=3458410 RepID=UPI00403E3098